MDQYKVNLIDNILTAQSQDEVKFYIQSAISSLVQNKVNGHLINRFTDKISGELQLLSPMNKDSQQWSNIQMAKIVFNRIRRKYDEPMT